MEVKDREAQGHNREVVSEGSVYQGRWGDEQKVDIRHEGRVRQLEMMKSHIHRGPKV